VLEITVNRIKKLSNKLRYLRFSLSFIKPLSFTRLRNIILLIAKGITNISSTAVESWLNNTNSMAVGAGNAIPVLKNHALEENNI
jgi:hypothetical protein